MRYVADASYIASLLLPDEKADLKGFDRKTFFINGVTCPGILQLEVASVLLKSERRKRINPEQAKELSAIFDEFPILLQPTLTHEQRHVVVSLSRKHDLTPYDASYLELAIRLDLHLISLDVELIQAGQREGISVNRF